MDFEDFAWRTFVLATVNGVVMWLAIKLIGFWNERNKLPAAILWSIPISALVHTGFEFGGYMYIPVFYVLAFMIFYGALLKWYDLEIGQTLGVAFVTIVADVAAYVALTRIGILPPLS